METSTHAPVLRLQGITKRFGPLLANDAISLTLHRGEIVALLGENGAGKSTLMSLLFGHYVADAGHIEVMGQRLPPGQPRAALAAGIGMVHQHFALADNLSVLDNIMAGGTSLARLSLDTVGARHKLLEVAQQFGLEVKPDAHVGTLSVGERQRVEILKALYRGARILILDEPTAVLTPAESEALFTTLGQMVAQGLSIIFISHKLGEVLRVSHRVAVLRHGKLVAEAATSGCTQNQLAQWMVGHAIAPPERRPTQQVGESVCSLRCVHSNPSKRKDSRDQIKNISLELHAGEIVAIAGVSGNGQVPLADVLCGVREITSGQFSYLGRPLPKSPAQLMAQGLARIPEDRYHTGVIGDLPLWENAVSERLRSRWFSLLGWVRRGAAQRYAQQVCDTFDVRGGGLHAPARALSGGNMQKLILGRALTPPRTKRRQAPAPRLIVAHQPTWGLDIGAVQFVQQQLIAARDAGAAVLVISDDLDEVLALGDRIAVMHQGWLTPARPPAEWTRESIGLAMAGVMKNAHD